MRTSNHNRQLRKQENEVQETSHFGKMQLSTETTQRLRNSSPKKRNRSLTCDNPACHNRTFADEPNLNRHQREVHGHAQYHCPVEACERHTRGFKRRDNCINHQKRSHGNLKSLKKIPDDNIQASRDGSIHVTENGGGASSSEGEERSVEENMASKGSDTLEQKLDSLKALLRKKKKVEEEILRAREELQQALQP